MKGLYGPEYIVRQITVAQDAPVLKTSQGSMTACFLEGVVDMSFQGRP